MLTRVLVGVITVYPGIYCVWSFPNETDRKLTLFSDSAPLDKKNIEHDYAVIELAKKAGDDYMRVTISPEVNQLPVNRIHFR